MPGPPLRRHQHNTSLVQSISRELYPVQRTLHPDTARRWLQKCNDEHGLHCQNARKIRSNGRQAPLWFIDVKSKKLTPAIADARYAALSYVWGDSNTLLATTKNIDQLQGEGALANAPRTIRDAVKFARDEIDVPFLWVDCLCIVQDDEAQLASQIGAMASIYAHAYVTLVAGSSSHADSGLRSPTATSFWTRRESGGPLPNSANAAFTRHGRLLGRSPWQQRGWTLQELVFSQRAIFFFDGAITWECHCTTWYDAIDSPASPVLCQMRFSKAAQGLQHSSWPDLEEYMELVSDFSARRLTHDSDAQSAFMGVTSTLSAVFDGGFLFGLPEMFFHTALLWQPIGTIFRRSTSGDPRPEVLPSWSWMGWKGKIDPSSWQCGYGYVQRRNTTTEQQSHSWVRPTTCITIPILEWHTRAAIGSGERQIRCTGEEFRLMELQPELLPGNEKPIDQRVLLSAGWEVGWGTKGDDSEIGTPSFFHHSDHRTAFNYPISILEPGTLPIIGAQTNLLSCRTSRAWFRIDQRTCSRGWAKLVDDNGAWAGVVRGPRPFSPLPKRSQSYRDRYELDCEKHESSRARYESNRERHETNGGMYDCDATHEFIAISAGAASNNADERRVLVEWDDKERPRSRLCYEFYNVLWIERSDGIAYRKGLGRILRETWDSRPTNVIDVLLG